VEPQARGGLQQFLSGKDLKMMLEWIWFVVLTGASTLVLVLYALAGDSDFVEDTWASIVALFAVLCTVGALAASWPALGGPMHAHIEQLLPQKGTAIHHLTVTVLTCASCGVYLLVALVGPVSIGTTLRKRGNAHLRSIT
jgi:purine-cytosine permease-like protein